MELAALTDAEERVHILSSILEQDGAPPIVTALVTLLAPNLRH